MKNPISILFWSVHPRRKMAVLSALLSLSFVLGGSVISTPRPIHHWHGIETASPLLQTSQADDIAKSLEEWKVEVARRFPDAFVYATHGGDIMGEWGALAPGGGIERVSDLAKRLQRENPGRIIVLLVCNPGHYKLHIPGVYHATDSVWFYTDKQSDNTDPGRQQEASNVGNIYEFTDA